MSGFNSRALELFYIDGRPDGMLTARMFGWTGQLLVSPRTQLTEILARKEAAHCGVYLLLGEIDGEPHAYIGESDGVGNRIRQHDVAKDWWTTVVLVTAAGDELNKAYVRYLESRLIREAQRIGRTPLTNNTAPPAPNLSEADVGKMEIFLQNLLLVLPAVRVDIFIERARPRLNKGAATPEAPGAGMRFTLTSGKHSLRATAVLTDGEFIVEAGSTARLNWEGQGAGNYASLYQSLRRAGVIEPDGEHCVFTQNYAFKSPSAAAAVVLGQSSNGAVLWRTEVGQTYKDWEAASLNSPSA